MIQFSLFFYLAVLQLFVQLLDATVYSGYCGFVNERRRFGNEFPHFVHLEKATSEGL